MGVGIQLALYLVVISIISYIAFEFGLVTNPFVSFILTVIAAVVAQKLTLRYYKTKLKKKEPFQK